MFQKLLPNKPYRLRDSKSQLGLGGGLGMVTNKTRKKNKETPCKTRTVLGHAVNKGFNIKHKVTRV